MKKFYLFLSAFILLPATFANAADYFCPVKLDCTNKKCALGAIIDNTMQVITCIKSGNVPCDEGIYMLTGTAAYYAKVRYEGDAPCGYETVDQTNYIEIRPIWHNKLYADLNYKAGTNSWVKDPIHYGLARCDVSNGINNCPLTNTLQ